MTSRDGEMLLKLGDFTFSGKKEKGFKNSWSCYTHGTGCPARVHTELNIVVYAENSHNHPPTEFFV